MFYLEEFPLPQADNKLLVSDMKKNWGHDLVLEIKPVEY